MKYDKERFARAVAKAIHTTPLDGPDANQMADDATRLIESFPKFEQALKTVAVKMFLASTEGNEPMTSRLITTLGALEAVFMLGMWVREEMSREEKEERENGIRTAKPIEVV